MLVDRSIHLQLQHVVRNIATASHSAYRARDGVGRGKGMFRVVLRPLGVHVFKKGNGLVEKNGVTVTCMNKLFESCCLWLCVILNFWPVAYLNSAPPSAVPQIHSLTSAEASRTLSERSPHNTRGCYILLLLFSTLF